MRETDFLKWMRKQQQIAQSDTVEEAFDVFDADNDGFISKVTLVLL